jgi:F420H(2)-dependent quinone reductase
VADPHAPFAVVNRTVNPIVRTVLRSPAHRLLSGHLMLLTVTGRRSKRTFSFPVGYTELGADRLQVTLDWPDRKRWWRNLRGGAPVAVVLRGARRTGTGTTIGDEREGVVVEIELDPETGGAVTRDGGTRPPSRSPGP